MHIFLWCSSDSRSSNAILRTPGLESWCRGVGDATYNWAGSKFMHPPQSFCDFGLDVYTQNLTHFVRFKTKGLSNYLNVCKKTNTLDIYTSKMNIISNTYIFALIQLTTLLSNCSRKNVIFLHLCLSACEWCLDEINIIW